MEMKLGHREAMSRALVGGKDLGDGVGLGMPVRGESSVVEVERGEGPQEAPPCGDGLGTSSVLGGKKGNHLAEHGVGHVANVVNVIIIYPSVNF